MEPSIFTTLFKNTINTIIAVGSLFYSTIEGVRADFSYWEVDVYNNRVVVSTQLIHCFPDELDEIFNSGERVTIYYKLELYSNQENQPVYQKEFSYTILHSLLEKTYTVYKSEIETIHIGLEIIDAKNELSQLITFPTIEVAHLNNNSIYHFRITAWMENIQLQGMEKPLNLMYYWSNIRPVGNSLKFRDFISIQ
ncbi:MAG: DUF4390 domain-containing protein [Candidatus Marinimicrobia bacterium]|jgi:hypothetical protein|nr:DUF4390 domain-containing protein [Candidatus Neomarinimicrobiota bacterium]MBT4685086.1 DUF4390 domain-containing protein [Candidatus Neomarinimicrobiota bacterium]MBT6938635.1 DUF4390 domain-containing protein [Candidatus Neomarinimicrobiota bacterium]